MKTIEQIFKTHTGRICHRHDHVLKIYDEHFSRYRGKEVNVMEIGIAFGGGLEVWREYFGPKANIYGVDIVDNTDGVAGGNIKVILGDQNDEGFLSSLKAELPPMDIIIDDASHESARQIVTINSLLPSMRKNGIYAIEDLHCSYRDTYGGGWKHEGSIIEYSKKFIDWFHSQELPEQERRVIPEFMKDVYGVHFYRNVLLIDKVDGAFSEPISPLMVGKGTIADEFHKITGGRFDA